MATNVSLPDGEPNHLALIPRLEMAQRGKSNGLRVLLCRVDARVCGLPIEHIGETMRPLPVEPLLDMPPFVRGLSIVRGVPTPVLDARRLLGSSDSAGQRPERYVSLRLGARALVLAVDGVLGVGTVAAESLAALPPLLERAEAGLVAAVGALDHELLVILETFRLLPESLWSALEAESAGA